MCLWTRLTSVQQEETRFQTYKPNFQNCWDLQRDDVSIEAGTVHYGHIILVCEPGVMCCCRDIKDCPLHDFPICLKFFIPLSMWSIDSSFWPGCCAKIPQLPPLTFDGSFVAQPVVLWHKRIRVIWWPSTKKQIYSQMYWCELQTSSHVTYVIVLLSLVQFSIFQNVLYTFVVSNVSLLSNTVDDAVNRVRKENQRGFD